MPFVSISKRRARNHQLSPISEPNSSFDIIENEKSELPKNTVLLCPRKGIAPDNAAFVFSRRQILKASLRLLLEHLLHRESKHMHEEQFNQLNL